MLGAVDRALLLGTAAAWTLGTWAWSRRVARAAGAPAVARPRTRLERAFPLLWAGWLLAALGPALAPDPCAALCIVEPGSLAGRAAGLALVAAGTVLAVLGSRDLGASWRIGVDEATPGPLVARGIYRHTRNPIFEGMLLALLGIVAWAPTLPGALLWLASAALLRAQAAREEAFLAARHGPAYEAYMARTGRWGPRLRGRTGDGEA